MLRAGSRSCAASFWPRLCACIRTALFRAAAAVGVRVGSGTIPSVCGPSGLCGRRSFIAAARAACAQAAQGRSGCMCGCALAACAPTSSATPRETGAARERSPRRRRRRFRWRCRRRHRPGAPGRRRCEPSTCTVAPGCVQLTGPGLTARLRNEDPTRPAPPSRARRSR